MNILEELWYGNIEPAEYDISPSKEYKELLQLISRNEDKLLATMTETQKELFTKYADCVREHQVIFFNEVSFPTTDISPIHVWTYDVDPPLKLSLMAAL